MRKQEDKRKQTKKVSKDNAALNKKTKNYSFLTVFYLKFLIRHEIVAVFPVL